MGTITKIDTLGTPVIGTDDREAHLKSWIAAYTRPRSEKKVSLELNKLGIENYLPTQIRISQWSDRKKKIEVAVIPMVIFIKIENDQLIQLRKLPLIAKAISYPGKKEVASIPETDINKLKFILGQSDIPVSIDPYALFINENVRVVRGPLMGATGEIVGSVGNESEILVSLNVLGGARLKINRINLEHLKSK